MAAGATHIPPRWEARKFVEVGASGKLEALWEIWRRLVLILREEQFEELLYSVRSQRYVAPREACMHAAGPARAAADLDLDMRGNVQFISSGFPLHMTMSFSECAL